MPDLDESLMERLQRTVPSARLVKAFSCMGNALVVDPIFPTDGRCSSYEVSRPR